MGLMISSHNFDDAVNGSKGLRFSGPPEHIGIQGGFSCQYERNNIWLCIIGTVFRIE